MAIEAGDIVKLDYEGKLEDGTVFDASKHGDHSHPLEFEVGAGQVIPGFEDAVKGLKKGDKKEFKLTPAQSYGERNEELQRDIPKDSMPPLPEGQELKEGMVLMAKTPEGGNISVRIVEIKEDSVTMDFNHALAGKVLIFNIEVIDVKKKSS